MHHPFENNRIPIPPPYPSDSLVDRQQESAHMLNYKFTIYALTSQTEKKHSMVSC